MKKTSPKKLLIFMLAVLLIFSFAGCGGDTDGENGKNDGNDGNGEAVSLFESLPENFTFSSGAGGWYTDISFESNGNFTGAFRDSDMGVTGEDYPNGTVYAADFKGQFTEPVKINEYTYSMRLESLTLEKEVGTEEIEDGILYVSSGAYGFDNADEFLIYLPGAPMADLPDGFISWTYGFINPDEETLPVYGIYNVGGEEGFIAY